ncbi:hypothetical protein LINGRAHAP2_LOCUS12002 [Linum grandiflorum]
MKEDMYKKVEKVWPPELVRVMKQTKQPFLNLIYDCDPLQKMVFEEANVVLVGDAAHPTTPPLLKKHKHVDSRCNSAGEVRREMGGQGFGFGGAERASADSGTGDLPVKSLILRKIVFPLEYESP